jgi:hypothetical protein
MAWLLLGALACARRDPVDSVQPKTQAAATQATPAPPVRAPSPADAIAAATQWLELLRDGDQKGLAGATHYPFELHGGTGQCGDESALSSEALSSAVSCLINDDNAIGLLRNNDHADIELLPTEHVAAWANEWKVSPPPGQLVETAFVRSDSRLRLYLSIVDGGVAGIWRSGVAASWAVQLANEWLDAVRQRDPDRLARVTAYPFEIRDGGRDATCGKGRANEPAALSKAVDCLFKSSELHRALTDSPSPGIIAYEPDSPIPDWIEPWWQENEHAELQRAMTLAATVEGYEYNFQMLMARSGVRVVWKYGSFEARD